MYIPRFESVSTSVVPFCRRTTPGRPNGLLIFQNDMFASVGVMIVPTLDSLEFETQSNLSRFLALTISPLLAMELEDTVSSDLRAYIPAPVYQIIGI